MIGLASRRRILALVVLASLHFVGCNTVKTWVGKYPQLEVVAATGSTVKSVYVIVAPAAELEGSDEPANLPGFVRAARRSKYLAFGQYSPDFSGEGAWIERTMDTLEAIKFVPTKGPNLAVRIVGTLPETAKDPEICAIAYFGGDQWRSYKLNAARIAEDTQEKVFVRQGSLGK